MFREMRRNRQLLPEEESVAILVRNTSGVLALLGDEGYPYALPISYVYADGKLYFHSALTGHKVEAIRGCNKASFCVIDRDEVHPERYTTHYRSVIAFGKVRILEQPEEIRASIEALADKYAPDLREGSREEIRKEAGRFCMIELAVEHLTGKEAIELTRQRQPGK